MESTKKRTWLLDRLSRARRSGDQGVTLVETLIAMILFAIIGTVVTQAVLDTHKLVRATTDQTDGLTDVRVATERLVRDIRDARSVLCNPSGTPAALLPDTSCTYHLQLWIDYNSDYVQQASETVTWNLRAGAKAGQYDLIRTVSGQPSVVEARTIVRNVAFGYDLLPGATAPAPGAAHTTTVNTNMFYDSVLRSGTSTKTVSVTARLRNVS
ncbi:MAG: PulJ/GspJ family protein [Mycobacteriales bacterium]